MITGKRTITSIQTILQLCKRILLLKKRSILSGIAVFIGILITFKLVQILQLGMNNMSSFVLFTIGYFLIKYAGYAFSSTMFSELNSRGVASQFYTLPASAFEKLSAAWLVSFLGFSMLALILLYVMATILNVSLLNLKQGKIMSEVSIFIIAQSFYLFGSVYFKANNFLNTVLAIIVISFSLGIIFYFFSDQLLFLEESFFFISRLSFNNGVWQMITNIAITIIVTGPFYWLTYRRLKNRQVV